MNKKEAIAHGLKFYNTGNPCARGHISKRYTCNGMCWECCKTAYSKTRNTEYNRRWREENPDKCAKLNKAHDDLNHELMKTASNTYQRWTTKDIELVTKKSDSYTYDHTAEFLAKKLSRSLRAVEKCRERYGDHAGEQL